MIVALGLFFAVVWIALGADWLIEHLLRRERNSELIERLIDGGTIRPWRRR